MRFRAKFLSPIAIIENYSIIEDDSHVRNED